MMKMTLSRWQMLACFLFPIWSWAQPPIIANLSPSVPFIASSTHAWADYDGDGDPDLFLCGIDTLGQRNARILRNDFTAFVEDTSQSFPGLAFGDAAWADFDNDGDPDLAVTGSTYGKTPFSKLYINNGGLLQASTQTLPAMLGGHLLWADFDGDGDQDLFMAGLTARNGLMGYLLINQGNGTFLQVSQESFSPFEVGAIAAGDLNGDGLPDLVFAGADEFGDLRFKALRNLGGMAFGTFAHQLRGAYRASLDLADIDGDGKAEILLSGERSQPILEIIRLQGSQLQRESLSVRALSFGQSKWMDYDHDGLTDVLCTGRDAVGMATFYYKNTPSGFTTPSANQPVQTALYLNNLSFMDWNGDNNLDYMISGFNQSGKPRAFIFTFGTNTPTYQP